MRAEDILDDATNETVVGGIAVRKGTVGAFLANVRIWSDSQTSARARFMAARDLVNALPALRAIGLLDVFEPRKAALRDLIERYEQSVPPGASSPAATATMETTRMIDFIDPDGLSHTPTFSQVAIASGARTVHTSGQVAVDAEGNLVGGSDLGEQTRQAMCNLTIALAAAGATWADVVRTTTFVVGYRPDQRTVITAAKKPFYEGRTPPTSALIGVAALAQPEWLIEIDAIAVLDR